MNTSSSFNTRKNLGLALVLTAGVLMTAGGVLHSVGGLPALLDGLDQAGAQEALRSTVAIGWIWGSVGMLAMGFVTLLLHSQMRQGTSAGRPVGMVIGLSFLIFGLGASAYRFPSPHFLFFAGIGTLLLIGLWMLRKT